MGKLRVVQYINQFFAQVGGEDKADYPMEYHEGPMGPGLAFQQAFGDEAEIIGTIVCGDSYFGENTDKVKPEILKKVAELKPDLFIAGPAFNAGRYGFACATIAVAVQDELHIPVVTGMYVENPGADEAKSKVYIVSTKNSAAGMRDAVKKMAPLCLKINGKEFTTDYPMPSFDRVDPMPAVKDLSKATIALVTSGGIVPKGNPDHIESSNATRYGEYSIAGVNDLTAETYETAHGGYDPSYANQDADRVLPVDVLRDLEKEGKIGKLYDYFFTTVGNGTAVASAKKFSEEIGAKLKKDHVDAVILTST